MNKDKVVSFLLEKGADPTIKDKTEKNSLEIAQYYERTKIIEILNNFKKVLKTQLFIPFYSLNDQTTSIYPLLCSKLTPQKQHIMDQVYLYF